MPSSVPIKIDHLRFGLQFSARSGIKVMEFGVKRNPNHVLLMEEKDVVLCFLIYVVMGPMDRRKYSSRDKASARKSAVYAGRVMSTMRFWYKRARKCQVGVRVANGRSSIV